MKLKAWWNSIQVLRHCLSHSDIWHLRKPFFFSLAWKETEILLNKGRFLLSSNFIIFLCLSFTQRPLKHFKSQAELGENKLFPQLFGSVLAPAPPHPNNFVYYFSLRKWNLMWILSWFVIFFFLQFSLQLDSASAEPGARSIAHVKITSHSCYKHNHYCQFRASTSYFQPFWWRIPKPSLRK